MAELTIKDTGYASTADSGDPISVSYRAYGGEEISLKGISITTGSKGNYDNSPTLNNFNYADVNFGSIENRNVSIKGVILADSQEKTIVNSDTKSTTETSYTIQKTITIDKEIAYHKNSIRTDNASSMCSCKIIFKYEDSSSEEVEKTSTSASYGEKTYVNPEQDKVVEEIEVWLKTATSGFVALETNDTTVYVDDEGIETMYALSQLPETVGYKILYYKSLGTDNAKQLVTMMSNGHTLSSILQTRHNIDAAYNYLTVKFTSFTTTQKAGSPIINWSLDGIVLKYT